MVALMSSPTILYLQALALVGLDRSDEAMRERDWEAHFFAVRSRFFALNVLLNLITAPTASIDLAGNSAVSPVPFLALAPLNVLRLLSENRTLHALLACTVTALMTTQLLVPIITTVR